MTSEDKIRLALTRLGEANGLEWARRHASKPLVELNRALDAGVAPVDLERFLADSARDSGRYDEFVRIEAMRRLNEFFPRGFGNSERQQFGLSSGWAMWASLFEPSRKRLARDAWEALTQTLKEHPGWCPSQPDDELLLAAFEGTSFAPSEGATKLAAAVRRMEREAAKGNRPYSDVRAVRNFFRLPPGYGWIYGLYSVDGQVCNGGFLQFYENTGGLATHLAIDAYRALGRDDFCSIVTESLVYAIKNTDLVDKAVALPKEPIGPARAFEKLDAAYDGQSREAGPDWLDAALTELVVEHPEFF